MNIMTRPIAIEHIRLPILLFFLLTINCISFVDLVDKSNKNICKNVLFERKIIFYLGFGMLGI